MVEIPTSIFQCHLIQRKRDPIALPLDFLAFGEAGKAFNTCSSSPRKSGVRLRRKYALASVCHFQVLRHPDIQTRHALAGDLFFSAFKVMFSKLAFDRS